MKQSLISKDLLDAKKSFFQNPERVDEEVNPAWQKYCEIKGNAFDEVKEKYLLLKKSGTTFYNYLNHKIIASEVSQGDNASLAQFSYIFTRLDNAINSTLEELKNCTRTAPEKLKTRLESYHSLLILLQGVLKSQARVLETCIILEVMDRMTRNEHFKITLIAVLKESMATPIKTGSTLAIIGFILGAAVTIFTGGASMAVLGAACSVAGFSYSAGYLGHSFCLALTKEGQQKLVSRFQKDTLKEVIGLLAALLPLVSLGVHGLKTISGIPDLLGAADEAIGLAYGLKKADVVLKISQKVVGALSASFGAYNNVKLIINHRVLEEKSLRSQFKLFKEAVKEDEEEAADEIANSEALVSAFQPG